MSLFEHNLDEYLEQTSVFPHPKKGENLMAIPANPKIIQFERKAELKRIYRALGLTSKGKLRKTGGQKRLEKLLGRQRG